MDITIKKVGQRDGLERFVLVNPRSREVLTRNDVSEAKLRRFFSQRGASEAAIDQCLERARTLFNANQEAAPSDEGAESTDDLLFELGLGEDDDEH